MKIVFGKNFEDVVYLDPQKGSFNTTASGKVDYDFDDDTTVKLTINGYWYSRNTIDELIDFLKAAKEHLK